MSEHLQGSRTKVSIERDLQRAARDRGLAERIDRLERRVARVTAHLDGAMVTVLPAAQAIRPPGRPDPSVELQQIVSRRLAPGDGPT